VAQRFPRRVEACHQPIDRPRAEALAAATGRHPPAALGVRPLPPLVLQAGHADESGTRDLDFGGEGRVLAGCFVAVCCQEHPTPPHNAPP